MSNVVFSSLKTAVKGTALLMTSSAVSLVLWFFIRIIIVRNISQADFGIYSIALAVMSITAVLFSLGLSEGTTRCISVANGKGETGRVKGSIKSAIEIIFLSGIAAAVILYLTSDTLALKVFEIPELSTPIKIIAFAMIVAVLIDILISVFRGFRIMKTKAVYDMANPLLFMVLLAIVFLFKLPFISIFGAFLVANFMSMAGLVIHAQRTLNLSGILFHKIETYRKELLIFSIPLMGVALTGLVMTWTDTLMLGYFMRAEDVGVYNVGISLSKILMLPIAILNFVFMPIAGELFARSQMEDLKRTYQILTKWLFTLSFPVFLVLFFFPEMTLTFIFGKEYEGAATVLKLLSLRFIFTLLTGSSSLLLTVLGRSRLLMVIALIGASLNIALNYKMIPVFGLQGGALATLLSSFVGLTLCAVLLYRLSGIHPFTVKYLKPATVSVIPAVIIYAIAKSIPLHFWMMPIYFVLFLGGYLLAIFLTRSIEKEDISMFDAATAKMGLEMKFVKKLMQRFAHE